MKLDLPGGEWALLREPRKVSERSRRPITALIVRLYEDPNTMAALAGDTAAEAKVSGDQVAVLEQLNDAVVVALVDQWSFDVAVSADALLDLPGDVYAALRDTCAPMAKDLMADFTTPEMGDAESPS